MTKSNHLKNEPEAACNSRADSPMSAAVVCQTVYTVADENWPIAKPRRLAVVLTEQLLQEAQKHFRLHLVPWQRVMSCSWNVVSLEIETFLRNIVSARLRQA